MSTALAVCHGRFGRAALYRLDKTMTVHAHREGHIVLHVDGASGIVSVDGALCPIDPAWGAAINPWEAHGFQPQGADGLYLVLYVNPLWFQDAGRDEGFALTFAQSRISLGVDISRAAERLTNLLLGGNGVAPVDDALYALCSAALEQTRDWQGRSARAHPGLRERFSDHRVRRAIRLMKEGYAGEFDICGVAREAGLSRPHFFKLFKRQTGITPNLYLNTLRMDHAIDELTATRRSVTEIGARLGFSSQASFTRFFSANVGIPPSDYRRVTQIAAG
ncbi:MAG: AraC family transcriptional regulator [Pseudomonadota bacterium]